MRPISEQALSRGLRILMAVVDAPRPVSVTELSRQLGLHKATVSRMARALAEEGYLARDPASGGYMAGRELVARLRTSSWETTLRMYARPILVELSESSGETSALYVPVWPDRVCIDQVESRSGLRRQHTIGESWPLTVGASGRCFLAFCSAEEREEAIRQRPFRKYTEDSVVDRAAFDLALARVRRELVSYSFGETIAGMNGIAAPVFDRVGRTCAVISIGGPIHRWTAQAMAEFSPRLRDAALRLTGMIGGQLPSEGGNA
jgi:IclR family acetate operon transcriptional repressor